MCTFFTHKPKLFLGNFITDFFFNWLYIPLLILVMVPKIGLHPVSVMSMFTSGNQYLSLQESYDEQMGWFHYFYLIGISIYWHYYWIVQVYSIYDVAPSKKYILQEYLFIFGSYCSFSTHKLTKIYAFYLFKMHFMHNSLLCIW